MELVEEVKELLIETTNSSLSAVTWCSQIVLSTTLFAREERAESVSERTNRERYREFHSCHSRYAYVTLTASQRLP